MLKYASIYIVLSGKLIFTEYIIPRCFQTWRCCGCLCVRAHLSCLYEVVLPSWTPYFNTFSCPSFLETKEPVGKKLERKVSKTSSKENTIRNALMERKSQYFTENYIVTRINTMRQQHTHSIIRKKPLRFQQLSSCEDMSVMPQWPSQISERERASAFMRN